MHESDAQGQDRLHRNRHPDSSPNALHFTLLSTANAAFPEDIGDSSNPVSPTYLFLRVSHATLLLRSQPLRYTVGLLRSLGI